VHARDRRCEECFGLDFEVDGTLALDAEVLDERRVELAEDADELPIEMDAEAAAGMEKALEAMSVRRSESEVDAQLEAELFEDAFEIDRVGGTPFVAPERASIASVRERPEDFALAQVRHVNARPFVHLHVGELVVDVRRQ